MSISTSRFFALPRDGRRAPLRLGLLLVLLAGSLLMPWSMVAASEGDTELVGQVVLEYADDFEGGRAQLHRVLETSQGRFLLKGGRAAAAEPGTRVRVRGKLQGETLMLADSGSVTTLAATTSAGSSTDSAGASATNKRVAVLLINFSNSSSMKPCTHAFVRGLYFTNAGSVAAYFAEVSNGGMSISGDVFGWYTVSANTSSCNYVGWGTAGRQAASNAGVKLSDYDHVVHAFPRQSSCPWGGYAQVDGPYNYINGSMTPYVTIHELGHNFGAHHASSMTCTQGGSRVPLSNNCTTSEYGDPFDVMGQNASGPSNQRHLHTWHRRQVGFLGTSDQSTITLNGHYTVARAQAAGGTPRILRLPRPSTNDFYYLEFRQPYGRFDNFSSTAAVVGGVLVRIAPDGTRLQSRLLDMIPSTTTFSDAALSVGQTFTDSANSISLRTVSVSPSSATLRVQLGPDTVAPTTPGKLKATIATSTSIKLSWTASGDDLEVTGYRISRNGSLMTTVGATKLDYTDNKVVPGAGYSYSVVAFDAANNSSAPATVSMSSLVASTTAPTTPQKLSGKAQDKRYVQLSWTASSGGSGALTYRVFRNDVRIASGVTATGYRDRAPSVGTHAYRVRARDSAGKLSPFTPRISVKAVKSVATTAPTTPQNLSGKAQDRRYVQLSWTASSGGSGALTYRVFRNDVRIATGVTGTGYRDRAPSLGTHTYRVRARDSAGKLSPFTPRISVKAVRAV